MAKPQVLSRLCQSAIHEASPIIVAVLYDKLTVFQMIDIVSRKSENIVGKEENAGYQHFLLFPKCFQTLVFLDVVKTMDCLKNIYAKCY